MRAGWWFLALVYMTGIFFMSDQPGDALSWLRAPWDKLAHGLSYALLGYLLARASARPNLAWVLAAWFGASDEVHQAFVPLRSAGLDDWLADLLGAFLGSRLGGWQSARLRRPPPERPVSG
ncbi:VanZ family protein [Deinobacterium chartae]|uniref:VanZ family protein n=1 Tax=Deinobacterium chartae TaxID=521158 RepID=A0A841I069_9DEIO|nr:VanZ family protein [Deinobacterium chartae]